jgi:hypothetical protein
MRLLCVDKMIRIPKPAKTEFTTMYALGTFTFTNDSHIQLYWWNDTRSVIITNWNDWYIQKDGLIVDTLAHFLGADRSQVCVDNHFLFNNGCYTNGCAAPRDIVQNLLKCEWSDFACDKMVIYCNVWKKRVVRPYEDE